MVGDSGQADAKTGDEPPLPDYDKRVIEAWSRMGYRIPLPELPREEIDDFARRADEIERQFADRLARRTRVVLG